MPPQWLRSWQTDDRPSEIQSACFLSRLEPAPAKQGEKELSQVCSAPALFTRAPKGRFSRLACLRQLLLNSLNPRRRSTRAIGGFGNNLAA